MKDGCIGDNALPKIELPKVQFMACYRLPVGSLKLDLICCMLNFKIWDVKGTFHINMERNLKTHATEFFHSPFIYSQNGEFNKILDMLLMILIL